MKPLYVLVACAATACPAEEFPRADIVFLGELHDNPAHHAWQAEAVDALNPKAIVWEMLDSEEVRAITPALIGDAAALEDALGWADTGWPDFAMYHPIFTAEPEAAHFGAELPREQAGGILRDGRTSVAIDNADLAALLEADLTPEEAQERQVLQQAAHCGALPPEKLPGMVDVQRVRDTLLAETAIRALQETGGPVAVITGNGHARLDWGAGALAVAALEGTGATVFAVAQGEDDAPIPDGIFDLVRSTPAVARGNPCEVFRPIPPVAPD